MASWTMDMIQSAGYLGLTLLMFLENVFPPIPSEVVMPLAGYMVAQGQLSLTGVVLAGMAGSVLGALPLYYLGRKISEERLKQLADRHGRWLTVSRHDLDSAQGWFDRHGAAAVFFCRLVPAIRSLISIPAGITGMNMSLFLIYTALGTTLWSALLALLGYVLGSNFRQIGEYLDPVSWLVMAAIVVIYLVRIARHKGEEPA